MNDSIVTLIDKIDHLGGFINFPEKDFISVMKHRYYYSAPFGALIDNEARDEIDKLYVEYTEKDNE